MSEIYQLPDNNGNNGSGVGNIPFSLPIGGFGTMPMPKLEEKDFETEIKNKAE